MKKILLLGGSAQQISAIQYAKGAGYFTVLCDYLKDNPGQYVADRFYLISTTDKEAVLKIAKKEQVEGVVAYASDPAAQTAAYVAAKLNLPSNPYESVRILSEKHLFRKFLQEHNFNVPRSISFTLFNEEILEAVSGFNYPILVKPVDSSGSKGISRIYGAQDLEGAFRFASEHSRNKIIQIEEYIRMDHAYIVGGDIFVVNGKVKFWGLLNCHRDYDVNPLVPVGKSYPLDMSRYRIEIIHQEIQRLINSLKLQFGAFNVELLFNENDQLYFIEMGPRNGGNMIPDLLSMISGKNMIAATIECAMGNYEIDIAFDQCNEYYATYNLHSKRDGSYISIEFADNLEKHIIKKVLYKKEGDNVYFFDSADKALGIIFMKFNNKEELQQLLNNINRYIQIKLNAYEKTVGF